MTFVTAELGANWMGDFGLLEYMVIACKQQNINAVKFQALSKDILDRHKELHYYPKASVNPDNIEQIDEICKKHHLEWYCTPTEPKHVKMLEPYVNRYKIREADNKNKKLCDAVYSTGKKVIVSSLKPMKFADSRIVNLYCIPRYPTQFAEHNFYLMKQFDGFSNHCLNPFAMLKAVMFGAKYLEFHMTPTKDMFLLDNHVSYTPEESAELMRWISLWNEKKQMIAS